MTAVNFYGKGLPGLDEDHLPGKLIVLEGPDGVGRSTQIALLREWLEASGYAVFSSGLKRSELASQGIAAAKEGHTLSDLTMALFVPWISPTAWNVRSSRHCARGSWCSPIVTCIRSSPVRRCVGWTAGGCAR